MCALSEGGTAQSSLVPVTASSSFGRAASSLAQIVFVSCWRNCLARHPCSSPEAACERCAVTRLPASRIATAVNTGDDASQTGLDRHHDELRPAAVRQMLRLRESGELTTAHMRLIAESV